MMTTQKIIKNVRALPLGEQKKVLEALEGNLRHSVETPPSEAEVDRILFELGVIGNIPGDAEYTDKDDDFEPIQITGKPLSETIIEERR